MSVVTNVILRPGGCSPEKLQQAMSFEWDGRTFGLKVIFGDMVGGTKVLTDDLYIGAFNHLNLKDLLKHLRSIDWEFPENVQLMVLEHEDDWWRIINLF